MDKCAKNQFFIDDIDTYKDCDLDEWAKEIVYRHGGDGCTEKGKEGGVDERKEEDIVSQVDEIGRITNDRWKASGRRGEDSRSQAEHSNGTREPEAEHQGGENGCAISQEHRDGKQYTQHIGRNFHTLERCNQIHLADTQESTKGKEIYGIG